MVRAQVRGRRALSLVTLLCVLGSGSAWSFSGALSSFEDAITDILQRSSIQAFRNAGDTALALLDRSAKSVQAGCPNAGWVCPGCVLVGVDSAAAVFSNSCRLGRDWPASQLLECRGQQLNSTTTTWLQQGQCHRACSSKAEQICRGHRSLLQTGELPA